MEIFAILAGALCTISFFPQAFRALKNNTIIDRKFLILYLFGVLNWAMFSVTLSTINYPLFGISLIQGLLVMFLLLKSKKQ